jgi:histidinol dehydrogenase
MAEIDDIRKRIKELNPEALPLIELLRQSGSKTVQVIILEGMTEEEQLMASLEAVLKEVALSGNAALAEAEKKFDTLQVALKLAETSWKQRKKRC